MYPPGTIDVECFECGAKPYERCISLKEQHTKYVPHLIRTVEGAKQLRLREIRLCPNCKPHLIHPDKACSPECPCLEGYAT